MVSSPLLQGINWAFEGGVPENTVTHVSNHRTPRDGSLKSKLEYSFLEIHTHQGSSRTFAAVLSFHLVGQWTTDSKWDQTRWWNGDFCVGSSKRHQSSNLSVSWQSGSEPQIARWHKFGCGSEKFLWRSKRDSNSSCYLDVLFFHRTVCGIRSRPENAKVLPVSSCNPWSQWIEQFYQQLALRLFVGIIVVENARLFVRMPKHSHF